MAQKSNPETEGSEATEGNTARVGHHAGFGCAIFIAAIVMFLGIVAWSFYTLRKQDDAIAEFTTLTPAELPFPDPKDGMAEFEELDSRIKTFAEACKAKTPTTLALSPDDLNRMLSLMPSLNAYRGLVRFNEIKDDGLIATSFALPMNQMRFWEGKRHLVGDGHLQLTYQPAEFRLYLILHDLTTANAEVPEGFLYNFEHWLWLTPYYDDDETKAVLLQITGLHFAENKVWLLANDAEAPE